MRCQEIRQLLSCRLDGVLDDQQLDIVKKHLVKCQACRSYWRYLQSDAELLKEMPEVVPPAEFRNDLRKKLEALGAQKPGPLLRKSLLSRIPKSITNSWFAGAAALLIFIFGLSALGDISNIIKDNNWVQISQENENPELVNINEPDTVNSGDNESESDTVIEPGNGSEQKDTESSQAGKSGENVNAGSDVNRNAPDVNNQTGNDSKEVTNPASSDSENNNDNKIGEFYTTSGEQTKVIKSVKIRLAVDDLKAAGEQVNEIANAYCVTSEESETQDPAAGMHYTICVPVPEMHKAVEELETIGRVLINDIKNEDITEKYMQLEDRINVLNGKIVELEQKAVASESEEERTIIEQQIEEAVQEFDSCRYRLKGFDDAVTMATIDLILEIEQ